MNYVHDLPDTQATRREVVHTAKRLSKSVEVGREENYFRMASSGKERLLPSVSITGSIRYSVFQKVWQPFSAQG